MKQLMRPRSPQKIESKTALSPNKMPAHVGSCATDGSADLRSRRSTSLEGTALVVSCTLMPAIAAEELAADRTAKVTHKSALTFIPELSASTATPSRWPDAKGTP